MKTTLNCEAIHTEAHNAGLQAGNNTKIHGSCGFAYVHILMKKSNQRLYAKWLVNNKLGSKNSYRGGVAMPVFQFNQSELRKLAYAAAYSEVLYKHGIESSSYCLSD